MKFHHMTLSGLSGAVVTTLALGLCGTAQADDNIYWSIGISSPGVHVGVASAPPIWGRPVPMYPYPVVVAPRPVYYAPAPVYYGAPGWHHRSPGHGWKHGHGHFKHGRHR